MRVRIASGNQLAGAKPLDGDEWANAVKSKLALDSKTAPVVRMLFQ